MRAILVALVLFGAAPAAAYSGADPCRVVAANPGWRAALAEAAERFRVPKGVIFAVLDQESSLNPNAKGAGAQNESSVRNFGFAQANLQTWNWFRREARAPEASRSDFRDSALFVGWYFAQTERMNGVPRQDAVRQYLAYKLGHGGFARGAYTASQRAVAERLARRAEAAEARLANCSS
jgi:hypothetical protein